MDRVSLSSADIEKLLAWRDEHKDEVRTYPTPLKAVEIVCKESGYTIKGIRNGEILKLYLGRNGRNLGHIEFTRMSDGMMLQKKNRMEASADEVQSVLTVYCSLMALMASSPVMESSKERDDIEHHVTSPKKPHKSKSNRTTYIIRMENGRILAAPRGAHASPKGTFSVRGHYRHYKSGKVVWIAEYKKGTGQKKRKNYKLGGEKNGEAV